MTLCSVFCGSKSSTSYIQCCEYESCSMVNAIFLSLSEDLNEDIISINCA